MVGLVNCIFCIEGTCLYAVIQTNTLTDRYWLDKLPFYYSSNIKLRFEMLDKKPFYLLPSSLLVRWNYSGKYGRYCFSWTEVFGAEQRCLELNSRVLSWTVEFGAEQRCLELNEFEAEVSMGTKEGSMRTKGNYGN